MDSIQITHIAIVLAIVLTIGFPTFGVLTTHRFRHRLDYTPNLRKIGLYCIAWMSLIGLLGSTFGWLDGLVRYSGESLQLLTVEHEEVKILKKDAQRTRDSGNRKFWISISTPRQDRVQVSKLFYESVAIEQTIPVAHTAFPHVYWPTQDSFSLTKFTNFLFCYAFIIFCSFGLFAFAWLPDRSPELKKETDTN